mgnify:CR=1 FL=1
MGLLDSSTLTVNAMLTTRGRELLSTEGNLDITQFSLSDEEIDYSLYDRKHPAGTNAFGRILENTTVLEASPNRSKLNSYLHNEITAITDIKLPRLNYPKVHWNAEISIKPETIGTAEQITEDYTFSIQNTNVIRFNRYFTENQPWQSSGDLRSGKINTWIAKGISVRAKIINPGATTTITVKGNVSGITKVVSMTVEANPDARVYAKPSVIDVTDPKFY